MAEAAYRPPFSSVDDVAADGGRAAGRRRPVSAVWTAGALVVTAALIYVAVSVLPGPLGPGLGVLGVGVVAALVFYSLDRPVLAVSVLLVCTFLREALKNAALPLEPAMMALGIVVAAGVVAVVRRASQAPSFGPLEAAMALFLLWNIGSALAPHPYEPGGAQPLGETYSVYHFIIAGTIMPFVLYVIGRFVFDRESSVRALLWMVIGFAAYSVWVSIAQFAAPSLVWPRYILEIPKDNNWSERAVGVFTQPVVNGLMMIVGFVIAVHLAYDAATRTWQRVLLAILAATSLIGIYLTYTRVVWLGFLLVVVLGAVFLQRGRPVYLTMIAGLVVAVAVSWRTLLSEDRSAGGVGSSYEVEDRLNMWATAFWAIREKPWFGWGVGTFDQINTYHHQQWSPEVPWVRGYAIVSHFTELGIFAELGIVGLVLWLAVVYLIVRNLRYAVRTLPDHGLVGRDLAVIASSLFLVWVITGFTADLRFFEFMATLLMLLIGIVVGAAQRLDLVGQHAPPPTPDESADEDLLYLTAR